MPQALLQYETAIRLAAFFGVLALVALAEIAAPRRRLTVSKLRRWASNLGIVFLNSMLVRVLLPATAAGFAIFAAGRGWGAFNYLDIPSWLAIATSVIILDCAIYLQHVMFHAVPAFWRLHRMHHADLDFDVTTGARFHPIEILLSMVIKFAVIAVIGAPAAAVIIFEVLLNATSMFNHGNLRLPLGLDRALPHAIALWPLILAGGAMIIASCPVFNSMNFHPGSVRILAANSSNEPVGGLEQ